MVNPLRKLPAEEDLEIAAWRADPFRYGSRWKRTRLPNGEVLDQEIPLTPDDLLDPQLGDEVTQSSPHARIVTTLHDLLDRHFQSDPDVLVLFDMKILWGIPGLPEPSTDLAVVRGIRDKEGVRSTFKVVEEGVLPCLIVEVVSYSDADVYRNDHDAKVKLYQRIGIPEYLIVDPSFPPHEPLVLTGYRMGADRRYRLIEPDPAGRLLSETTNLLFAPSEDRRAVRVSDAGTGEWLLNSKEEEVGRKAAEERALREAKARKAAEEQTRLEAEQRKAAEAEIARLRAEIERLKSR
jgi:Uma2 family endonuclease